MIWKTDHLTQRPEFLSDQPDVLSHLLTWVRLRGERVYRAEMHDPWHLTFPAGSSHVHLITEGKATLRLPTGMSYPLSQNDLVLLPHGRGHELHGAVVTGQLPLDAFDRNIHDAGLREITNQGSNVVARFIGGLFRYDRLPLPPVLMSLPLVIHLAAPLEGTHDWRGPMARFLVDEVDHPAPGSSLMISRIIDLMIIRTLRSWAEQQPAGAAWLGGAREERLCRALAAIHDEPARHWTVEDLAGMAGMSRSVFAERFTRAIGEPPLRYLTRWRLSVAVDLLQEHGLSIGEVARAVGYDSEAGFSRAFKAFHGAAPSTFWKIRMPPAI